MKVKLAREAGLAGFWHEARSLLAHQVPPELVEWEPDSDAPATLQMRTRSHATQPVHSIPRAVTAIVPASFLRLCEVVVLHKDARRIALLYRLLWRLIHEPGLRHTAFDVDMAAAQQMAQAVRRDMHKMKALLHFREIGFDNRPGPWLVACYAPTHHIVETLAPWLAQRFVDRRCSVFTPQCCVHWDGQQLHFSPGTPPDQLPALEAPDNQWLDYQRALLARLKQS